MDIIGIVVLVVSFFFLLTVGVPIAYSIGVAGVLTMLVHIDSLPALTTYALRMASGSSLPARLIASTSILPAS